MNMPRLLQSLGAKFLLITLPLTLLVSAGYILAARNLDLAERRADLERRLMALAGVNAAVLARDLWNFDTEGVRLALEALLHDGGIRGAVVLDERGKPVASAGVVQSARDLRSSIEREIRYATFRGEQRIGMLRIIPDLAGIEAQADEGLVRDMGLAGLLLLALVGSMLAAHRLTVARPLSRFLAAIRRAEREGPRVPVDWRSRDELGAVIAGYNGLISRLAANEEALRGASRAKSVFLASLSHEVRTPLAAILGMAEVLGDSDLDDEQRRRLATLAAAGELLRGIVDQTLDLARVESGRIALAREDFALAEAVEECRAMVASHARGKGLTLSCVLDPGLPERVVGDPVRLRQVLINLLSNAVKFTAAGSVTLMCSPAGGDRVRFAVHDTGVGIAPERREAVFEMFSHGADDPSAHQGGAGLGLSISRAIVRGMGGRLELQSSPGRGSTFYFDVALPAASAPAQEPSRDSPPAPPIPAPSARARVLLVEDSPTNRELVRLFFKQEPLDIEIAEDGEQALERLRQGGIDLVLMDLHMPVMDGLTATMRLREHERELGLPPVPVLALTADAFEETRQRCLEVGCDDFLAKPVRKEQMLGSVRRLLAARRSTPRDPA